MVGGGMGAGGEEAWQNQDARGAMKDRRVPVADDAVKLAVGPGPSQKYPEGGAAERRKGQELLKVSAGSPHTRGRTKPARGRVGT